MPTIADDATGHVADVKLTCIPRRFPWITNTKAWNTTSGGRLAPRITSGFQEIRMNSKLLTSTLLAAALLAAPAVAFAQAETTAPAAKNNMQATPPAENNVNAKGTHFRAGTTTGLGSQSEGRARPGGQSVARKPAD
jgi:hypothetical protein